MKNTNPLLKAISGLAPEKDYLTTKINFMSLNTLSLLVRKNLLRLFFGNYADKAHLRQKLQRRKQVAKEKILFLQVKTVILLMTMLLTGSLKGFSQISVTRNNVPLPVVFAEIEKQSNYRFFYNESLLAKTKNISIDVKNVSLENVLENCFRNQPVTYTMIDNTVVVKPRDIIKKNEQASNLPLRITVNGKVTNSDGEPVAGATVGVKGTDIAIATGPDGSFALADVDENATLVISSVAHLGQEIKLNKRTSLSISLKQKISDLDEAVVVAYNTTTRRSNTGAVTVVKGEQIQTLPNRSFEKSLQGLVPGLLVNSGNGQPGSAPNNFVLRGIATGGYPSSWQSYRSPLVVIDGTPVYQDQLIKLGGSSESSPVSNPMAQINPSDIETISVLKDAAAISLYGSKASNGVILITTKKGKAGKTKFSFRHQTDISERLQDPKVLNQQEYIELLFETYKNSNPGMSDAEIFADLRASALGDSSNSVWFPTIIRAPGDTSFYPAADWNSQYYKRNAVTVTNEIAISGGNEKSNFYLGLEYSKQDGIIRNTGFDRKSIRFNYENKVAPWLKLGLNTALSYTIQDYISMGSSPEKILSASPLLPIRLQDGKYMYNYSWGSSFYGNSFIANPIGASELNINRNTSYRGLSKAYGEIKFKDFTLTSNVGVDFILNENKLKSHPEFILPGDVVAGTGSILDQSIRNAIVISTNMLRYDRLLKNSHRINLLLGQEAQVWTNKYTHVERRGFAGNPDATDPSAGVIYDGKASSDKHTLLSYFGQVNYAFHDKYFLSGNIRTDGSSRFGIDKKFGTYWSAGAGWLVSAEPFFKGTKSWLNYLKIRGSIGSAGNSAAIAGVIRYDKLQLRNFLNNTAVLPVRTTNPGNPDIQWEQTLTWDAGIESRFWNERITATMDIYNRKTSKLISDNIPLPATAGFYTITDNVGDLKNYGLELSLSADIIRSKDFRWNINANWSRNHSKLTKSFFPLIYLSGSLYNKEGEEYNSFFLPRWAGVNSDNGRPLWIDSTGKPNEDYYAAKPEIAGKAQPDGFGAVTSSFSYKGFELSAMIYYQYGFQIYQYNLLLDDGMNPYLNQSKDALNRWQKPGDIALNPRRLLYGIENTVSGQVYDLGSYTSTRFLYDGDFIRLSNVSFAYSFPKKLLSRLHIGMLKVFIQGHNLATWTKYKGQDPENTSSNGSGNFLYPQQRSWSIGANLNF